MRALATRSFRCGASGRTPRTEDGHQASWSVSLLDPGNKASADCDKEPSFAASDSLIGFSLNFIENAESVSPLRGNTKFHGPASGIKADLGKFQSWGSHFVTEQFSKGR